VSTTGIKIPVTLSEGATPAGDRILKIDGPALVPFAPTTISVTARSAIALACAILIELQVSGTEFVNLIAEIDHL
jgi:hypothetical protein